MKKRIAVIMVAAVSLMGCGIATTSICKETAEKKTEEAPKTGLVKYEFETFDNVKVVVDEHNIIVQKTSDDPEYSELVSESARGNIIAPGRDFVYLEDDDYYYVADLPGQLITVADKRKAVAENPGFFETDSWRISYDTDRWYGYVNEEGNVIINYTGECAGTSLIEISELDVPAAGEAVKILAEKKGKELTVIDALDGEKCACSAYAADEVYESGLYIANFYTLYECNGKVIVLDEAVTHDDDNARAEALGEVFASVKNALELKAGEEL